MNRAFICILTIFFPFLSVGHAQTSESELVRPVARAGEIPPTRWEHRPESDVWTRNALVALQDHGQALIDVVPRDIDEWCPGYRSAEAPARRAFWVGFMSALAKHESTYKPNAVGGGGKWYGLLQILPATARGYGCKARSGTALKDGSANLSCAIRIMAVTVPRDQAIAIKDRKWRGVAADWGPMRSSKKRKDMSEWLRAQNYCAVTKSVRPQKRPVKENDRGG